MTIDRRVFLKTGLFACLVPGLSLSRAAQGANTILKFVFEDGTVQQLYFKISKDKKSNKFIWMCVGNTMNHYSCTIKTSYDFDRFFKIGDLKTFDEIKPIHEYEGFDKFGNLVYSGVATEKIWII